MKTINTLLCFLSLVTLLPSCKKIDGRGPVVTQTRSVSGFHEISSDISADVYITYGDEYSLQIEAQQNILDVTETVLDGDRLTIRLKNNVRISGNDPMTVRITTPDISGLILNGSGNMQVTNMFETGNLRLRISGSGNIYVPGITVSELDAVVSGSGEMHVSGGSAEKETLHISGSGNMDFLGLQATHADITISGSGDARVSVSGTLRVHISGSGNVYYQGTPAIDADISGSGKLKRI